MQCWMRADGKWDLVKAVGHVSGRNLGEPANQVGADAHDQLDDDMTLTRRITVRCVDCKSLSELNVSNNGSYIDTNVVAFTVFRLR